MNRSEVDKFFDGIRQKFPIFAPVQVTPLSKKKNREFFVKRVENAKEVDYSGMIPVNSWKQLFLPDCETLFNFQKGRVVKRKKDYSKVCAWNMTILDLRALGLYDLVFSEDPHYQARRQNILVVGFSQGAPALENFAAWKVFSMNLEENILEHVPFDIFLERDQKGRFGFYAGSVMGGEILEKQKIRDYKFVQFAGLIPEEGPDKRMSAIYEKMKAAGQHPLWDELDKICLACGKCSIVCPTCFCFDLEDQSEKDTTLRKRLWASCFYPEFTQVAGGKDYTDTVKKKIKFWYDHKFLRIPREYRVPGCVSCNRCTKVCPVGIDIIKNLARITSGK